MLIDGDGGDEAVLQSALTYYRGAEARGGQITAGQLAGEHSLNLQRFYNLVCWVYGSNPDKHADLVGGDLLPEGRASRCPSEYQQIDRAWSTLLEDVLVAEG